MYEKCLSATEDRDWSSRDIRELIAEVGRLRAILTLAHDQARGLVERRRYLRPEEFARELDLLIDQLNHALRNNGGEG